MRQGTVHGALGAILLMALAIAPGSAAPARAADAPAATRTTIGKPAHEAGDPWARGSTWLSLRAGYARAKHDGSAGGNLGYGFGFSRMMFRSWSLGGYAQYDVLGRFDDATESEFAFTAEAARHFKWGSALHSYLGGGGGTYYHKTYRTGSDFSDPRGGGYVLLGANTPVSARGLIGMDVRGALVGGDKGRSNPVFGVEKARSLHWSVKVNWSYAY